MRTLLKLSVVAIALLFSGINNPLEAQVTPLQPELDYAHQNLNSSKLTTGILINKAPCFANIGWYDGIKDSACSYTNLKQMYYELYQAAYDKTSHKSPDSVYNYALNLFNQNIIPILIVDYNYNAFKPYAHQNGLISLDNSGIIQDNTPQNSTPFDLRRAFAASTVFAHTHLNTVNYKLDPNLYLSNISTPISTIEADFDNGNGYQTVIFGNTYPVTYSTVGYRDVRFRITYTDSTVMVAHTNIHINGSLPSNNTSTPPPATRWYASATATTFQSWGTSPPSNFWTNGSSSITIVMGKDTATGIEHACLTQPIIFVEGIDFGDAHNGRHGDLGLVDFYTFNPDYPQIQHGHYLFDDLNALGYDIIYIDFWAGAAPMVDNSMLLVNIIQGLNNMKCGQQEENVIVGASMGGQLARYALAYMEQNNIKHCTREYVSFDSPHKGANIPLGLQHFLQYFGAAGNQAALTAFNKLSRPASQELLLAHTIDTTTTNPYQVINPLRYAWLQNRDALGYPTKLRKSACINGSSINLGQGFADGAQIIDYNHDVWLFSQIRGNAWSMYGYYDVDYGYKIFHGNLPGNNNETRANPPYGASTPTWDNCPGSPHEGIASVDGPVFQDIVNWSLDWDTSTYLGYIHALVPKTTFIPSISALDINTTDLHFDIQGTIINKDEPMPGVHPWDAVYFQGTNQLHVEITHPSAGQTFTNSEWLLQELLKNKNALKSLLINETYNLGRFKNKLYGVVVDSAGVLKVNDHGNTEYGAGAPTVTGSTHFVTTNECGATVTIKSGGIMQVGSSDGINKAVVTITSGNQFNLLSGGKLIINDSSKVIIEEGAKMAFHPGAEIQLLGNNAVLEIKGELEIHPNAIFTFTFPNNTSGYVKLCPNYTNNVVKMTYGTAAINLQGNGVSDKVLEVTSESLIIPANCTDFSIHLATVELGANARIAVVGSNTNINISNSTFTSTATGGNSHRGLQIFGQPNVNIFASFFEKGQYGIYAPLFYGGSPLSLNSVTFRECGTGLYTQGKGVTMDNVEFYDNYYGWHANLMSFPSSVIEVSAGSQATGSNTTGIVYSGGANSTLNIHNSIMSDNYSEGVWVDGAQLKMSCSQVTNNTNYGLLMGEHSVLDISGEPGGGGGFIDLSGNSPLSTNGYAIYLFNARDLYLNNGYNKITPGVTPGTHCQSLSIGCVEAINGTLSKEYSEGCNFDCSDIHLAAYNNEWIYSNMVPRWGDEYWINTSYQCTNQNEVPISQRRIILDADPMATYLSCEENTEPDPGNAESSIFNNCAECGTVNTEDFTDVPFAEAVIKAISAMTDTSIQNPNKTAVSYFVQILSGAYASSATQSKQNLMSYARNQMLDALGKAVQNNEIPISQNYPTISTEVQAVINLLKDVIDHTPCGPGYHERLATSMQIAQIYHLVDRRDSALAQLYATSNWATPDDAAFVSKWICGIEVEEMVLSQQIDITAFDSAMSVCPGTGNRIASNESVEENINLKDESLVSVTPNPNNGNMSIKYKIDEQQAGRIVIYDITGKIVFQSSVNGRDGKLEINVGHLTEGVYFFRVYSGDKAVAQDKLVIIK